jgi:hypothetical protein
MARHRSGLTKKQKRLIKRYDKQGEVAKKIKRA